jgi:hypothetical protein
MIWQHAVGWSIEAGVASGLTGYVIATVIEHKQQRKGVSMFPGPGATIHRNEAGEPIGWSYESTDAPDFDPYEDADRFVDEDDEEYERG